MQKLSHYWSRFVSFAGLAGIVVTLALMPIDRLPYLHHIPFGLGFISLLLLLLAAGDKIIRRFIGRDYRLLKKYFMIGGLLALPVLGYAISTTYAIDQTVALSSAKLLLAVTLRAYCFYILLSESPGLWPFIKKTIYWISAVVVAFGFLQFILDVFGAPQALTDLRNCCTSNSTYVFPRVYSTALEPLYLDHFLLIPLWLLTFDFLRSKPARRDKFLVRLFIGTACLFILTLARSADIGIILAGLIFYLGLRHQQKLKDFWRFMTRQWLKALLAAMVLVAMSGVVSLYIPKDALHGSRSGLGSLGLFGSHQLDVNDESARTRYDLWPKSIGFIEQRPLQGVGADNSRIRLDLYDYHRGISVKKLQPFNNDLIALLVDLGLLGVLAFGPLVLYLLWITIRLYKSHWQSSTAGLALVLVGMLIQGNFFQSLLLTRLWVIVGLVLASFSLSPVGKQTVAKK